MSSVTAVRVGETNKMSIRKDGVEICVCKMSELGEAMEKILVEERKKQDEKTS